MTKLDIVILVLLAWGLVRGFYRGIISELASLVGVGVGFWAAHRWYAGWAHDLSGWVTNRESVWVMHPEYVKILAFIVIFAFIYFCVSVSGWGIKTLLKVARLGFLDRLLGSLFGIFKMAIVGSILIMIFTVFYPQGEATVAENSKTAPYVMMVGERLIRFAPPDWRQDFKEKLNALKIAWKEKR
ncbi:MAG: CvpA family protein [Thermodesulfobacteriota bacterium]